jgi:hypothetical protein
MRIRGRLTPGQDGDEGGGSDRYTGAAFTIDFRLAGSHCTVQIQHADAPADGEAPTTWEPVGEPEALWGGETFLALPSGLKDRIRLSLRDEAGGSDLRTWLLPEDQP